MSSELSVDLNQQSPFGRNLTQVDIWLDDGTCYSVPANFIEECSISESYPNRHNIGAPSFLVDVGPAKRRVKLVLRVDMSRPIIVRKEHDQNTVLPVIASADPPSQPETIYPTVAEVSSD